MASRGSAKTFPPVGSRIMDITVRVFAWGTHLHSSHEENPTQSGENRKIMYIMVYDSQEKGFFFLHFFSLA